MPSPRRSSNCDRPPCLTTRDRPNRRTRTAAARTATEGPPVPPAKEDELDRDRLDRDRDDDDQDDGGAAENSMDATRHDGGDEDRLDIHSVLSGNAAENGDGEDDDDNKGGGACPDRRGDEAGSRRRSDEPPAAPAAKGGRRGRRPAVQA